MTFSKLGLPEPLLKAIKDVGYSKATPIQAQAIPLALADRDLVGIAQTGTGKTAAFTLPILAQLAKRKAKNTGSRALILAPTREIVTQIHESLTQYGQYLDLRFAAIHGGVGEKSQIEALETGYEIIVATPGRLIDYVDRGLTVFRALETLVLDEADRMLDMGFLKDIRKIVRKCPQDRQTLMFSATLSRAVEKLTQDFQHRPVLLGIEHRQNTAETVDQAVYEVPGHLKFPLLKALLEEQSFYRVLIFVRTKDNAEGMTKALKKEKFLCEAIHGDRSQNQRQRALEKFKENKLQALIATDVAARGLDIPDVTHVINYDFPRSNDDYIHRIGRTGRADAEGEAVTFVTSGDDRNLAFLEKFIGKKISRKTLDHFDYSVPAPEKRVSKKGKSPSGSGKKNARKRPRK